MKKLFVFLLLIALNKVQAQNESSSNEIKKTIHTFFEGMHKGDTTIIGKVISDELKLQTTFINKDGKSILRTETRASFLNAVSKKNPDDIWHEKLMSFDILEDGILASVWTPYEFYFNNEFSHCGVNSFQLFKNNEKWEIIFIVDTRRKDGCKKMN